MKSIPELKDELTFLFKTAQLSQWMIGTNSGDFQSMLPGSDDNPTEYTLKQKLVDFVYNHPEEWTKNYRFIVDGGVDGDEGHKGSGLERKKIGAAILTSGMIHICQSEIYDPKGLARHIGFSKFVNSVKSWSDAGEIITMLTDCRFLFISEIYIAEDTNKTLLRTVAESLNDLLERRENQGSVTIMSIKPTAVKCIDGSSNYLGAALTSTIKQLGGTGGGTIIMKDKRLCRIAF